VIIRSLTELLTIFLKVKDVIDQDDVSFRLSED